MLVKQKIIDVDHHLLGHEIFGGPADVVLIEVVCQLEQFFIHPCSHRSKHLRGRDGIGVDPNGRTAPQQRIVIGCVCLQSGLRQEQTDPHHDRDSGKTFAFQENFLRG